MNTPQVSGALDRIVLMALMYAAGKGWITTADIANYLALIVGILGAAYSFWKNTNTSLVAKAAAVPGTTVVTTPELAAATPDQKNVVSSTNTNAEIMATVKENK